MDMAVKHLTTHFALHGVDDSHGITHALAVLTHLDNALSATSAALATERVLALRLAALLHDADDKKYFTTKNYVSGCEPQTLHPVRTPV